MSAVTDFKSIRVKLERLEQKAEFEAKNPMGEPNKLFWSPSSFNEAARKYMAENSKGFDLPDLRGQIRANG